LEIELKFIPNAFKHGVTEDEIWEVFLNDIVKCIIVKYKKSGTDIIYNAYGVTEDGNYLEIGYIRENTTLYRVIHAMDMRESARKRFKKIRGLK
jgi:hypothetical protein